MARLFCTHRPRIWLAGLLLVAHGLTAQAADTPEVRIGWSNWSDTEVTTKLASTIIQDQLKQPVKLVMADIGMHFQAMAIGNIDLIPMVWLPGTHKAYWEKYQDRLEDLGVLYEGRIGMAVPSIVPASEVSSIADLNKPGVRDKLEGRILASEPGNGQYKLAQQALADYQLDGYKLVPSSQTGMLKEMERNLGRDKWSVINAWSPHWMFSRYPLRYLDDPKNIFGGAEQIHAVARKGFSEQNPAVAAFFAKFSIPQEDLQQLMMQARETSADAAVAAYYAAHKDRFAAMVAPLHALQSHEPVNE